MRSDAPSKGCLSAGTGKSLLLKHILRALPQATTYVTASTGLAASVLGGTTLNAFAGQPSHHMPQPTDLTDICQWDAVLVVSSTP